MSRHIGFSEFSSVLFILCFSRLDSGIFDWCLSKYSWFFSASLFDRFLEELEDVTVCMSWKQIAGCSRNLEIIRVWGVWRSPRWLVGGLHGWEENGWPWDPSLTGAVLHDFTIGLLLVFDNLYFEENTFLYTLCICILCRTKANNWGYSNDITKSYLRLEQTKVWGRKIVDFSFLLYDFWFQSSRRVYVKFLGDWDGLLWKREFKKDQELMWSAAMSTEVDTQDFPVSENVLPRRRQRHWRGQSCMLRSFAVFNSLKENDWYKLRVSEPMVWCFGERASAVERMYSGLFGMSSGQRQEYEGLVFSSNFSNIHIFLK